MAKKKYPAFKKIVKPAKIKGGSLLKKYGIPKTRVPGLKKSR